MSVGYSLRDAENMYMSAAEAHGKLQERIDAVKRKIELEMQTVADNKSDPESHSGYTYYKSERDRVAKKLEKEHSTIDNKIKTLEAKKATYCEMIDNQIADLESKKEIVEGGIRVEDARYFSEMERIRNKLEHPEPNTTSFKKLKTDLAILEKEILASEEKCRDLRYATIAASEKQLERRAREAKEEERRQQHLAHIERMEALAAVERMQEATRKEEEARNKKRSEEAKAALLVAPKAEVTEVVESPKKKAGRPKIQIEWPLVPGKEYTMEQLWSVEIDYNTITDEQEEIYERAKAAASKRENVAGWWDMKYNKED